LGGVILDVPCERVISCNLGFCAMADNVGTSDLPPCLTDDACIGFCNEHMREALGDVPCESVISCNLGFCDISFEGFEGSSASDFSVSSGGPHCETTEECISICNGDPTITETLGGGTCEESAVCNMDDHTCEINYIVSCSEGGSECKEFCEKNFGLEAENGLSCDMIYTCNLDTNECGAAEDFGGFGSSGSGSSGSSGFSGHYSSSSSGFWPSSDFDSGSSGSSGFSGLYGSSASGFWPSSGFDSGSSGGSDMSVLYGSSASAYLPSSGFSGSSGSISSGYSVYSGSVSGSYGSDFSGCGSLPAFEKVSVLDCF